MFRLRVRCVGICAAWPKTMKCHEAKEKKNLFRLCLFSAIKLQLFDKLKEQSTLSLSPPPPTCADRKREKATHVFTLFSTLQSHMTIGCRVALPYMGCRPLLLGSQHTAGKKPVLVVFQYCVI
jgi:hypothetical protein